ncbi:MAG: choice-of-anchor D domain-containing protein, partial [Burkholderiales bacterium]|nr:choice-of-anchor D domain-containing protein [Burkholderiales bacterium]
MKPFWVLAAWAAAFAAGAQTDVPGDAAAGRMLYRDTPQLRGSLQACAQCHPNPLNQRRGITLLDQQDHIRCAIQGGCGGATLAVYPYGAMAQFQGLVSGADIQHLARYIREPEVSAAWPRLTMAKLDVGSRPLGEATSFAVTLENRGERAFALRSLSLQGLGAADYEAQSGDCPATLPAGGQCALQVTHRPQCAVERAAQLRLSHDGPPVDLLLRLQGRGLGLERPEWQTEPAAQLDLGTALDTARPLLLRNACGGTLGLAHWRVEGPFVVQGDAASCRALGAEQSCGLQVSRRLDGGAPEALRPSQGALWLVPADGSPERRIALEAAALPPALLRTTPLSALPDTAVGASQSADVARLENTGTQEAWLSQLRSDAGAFALESPSAEHCREGQVLAAGRSCLLRLRFAPVAPGEQRMQVQVLAA